MRYAFRSGCGSSLLAAAVTTALLTACGSSASHSTAARRAHPVASTTSTSQVSPTDSTAAEAPVLLPTTSSVTVDLSAPGGYTATAVFAHSGVQPAQGGLRTGALTLGSACQVDDQTDAVENFTLVLTNTTKGFSATPGITMLALAPQSSQMTVSAEITSGGQAQCFNLTTGQPEAFSLQANSALPAGGSSTVTGFLVLSGYYSPSSPNGNTTSADSILLQFQSDATQFSISGNRGLITNDYVTNTTPLIPGTSGGCLVNPPCPASYNVGTS
jgi:hypothetical protein